MKSDIQSNTLLPAFTNIYDTYSPMLYDIALQISETKEDAEQLLIRTFLEIYTQKLFQNNSTSVCILLIKTMIKKNKEQFPANNYRSLKQFKSTPMLNKILCQFLNSENLLVAIGVSHSSARQLLRQEINLIRKQKPVAVADM